MISLFSHGQFGFVFAVVEAWELTRQLQPNVFVDTIVTPGDARLQRDRRSAGRGHGR